jgi:hypothetical protein
VRDLPVHVPLYDWLFLALGGVALILLGRHLQTGSTDPSLPNSNPLH